MITTVTDRKQESTTLATAAKVITRATEKARRQFAEYIATIGPHLAAAHDIHAKRGSGCWGYWCETELDCSKRQADRLLAAYALAGRLDGCDVRPGSEAVSRELARVDEGKQADAWRDVIEAGAAGSAADTRAQLIAAGHVKAPAIKAPAKPIDQVRDLIDQVRDLIASLSAADRKALAAEIGVTA